MATWSLLASINKIESFSQNDSNKSVSGKKPYFFLVLQMSTLLISYQICKIFQTTNPSASNTIGIIEFAESLWPNGRENSLYYSLNKLESLLLFWDKLKIHRYSNYLIKVLKQHIQKWCMLFSNIQEAHQELVQFFWKGCSDMSHWTFRNMKKIVGPKFSWCIG